MNTKNVTNAFIISGLILLSNALYAQESNPANDAIENIIIVGYPADVSGSAHILDKEELSIFKASDMLRMLRSVPGVYIQEEDGFGLRPNIGIRGSGIDRSGKIAVMEDGVLIAPAPYTASSAYYFPTARRMSAIEVLKGPSAVAVGPRTTGGALNMVSTQIPDEMGMSGELDFRAGNHDLTDTHAYLGNRGERFSWLVETVQQHTNGFKELDGPAGLDNGDTGFDIQDYMVKMQYDTDSSADLYQSLRVKLGATQQTSNETYLGLTDADYKVNPYRRYAASARDQFNGHHEQIQLSYIVDNNDNWRGEVTVYDNDFHRDWFKLQKIGGKSQSAITSDPITNAAAYAILTGAVTSADDAIVLRHNNRFYNSKGVQGKFSYDFDMSGMDTTINVGFRVHEDYEDRKQREDKFRMENMGLVTTTLAAPSSKTNRFSKSEVTSFFVSADMTMGNLSLSPGIRIEELDNVRYDYSTSDPLRTEGPTKTKRRSEDATIMGIGAMYKLNDDLRLIAGVHQGYQPPGAGSKAKAEESVNFEFGVRATLNDSMFEIIAFLSDYDNIVGTVTASTGGTADIGSQYDGGAVKVQGLEIGASRSITSSSGFEIPISLQYTLTSKAEFETSFESDFDGWGTAVVKGDRLPYMPKSQLRATIGIIGESMSANLSANYASEVRALAGQGGIPGNQLIDARWVLDAIANYKVNENVSAYVKIDNLLDEVYVAARRPAGIRPGMDRQISVGINIKL
ncbi:MAG: TonB-dependent receptor [Woeseiaceae bacterium]|nr:TonB-dependent receptor [Woeseiaceae bacterium]